MKRYYSVTTGGTGSERARKNLARKNFSGSHRSGSFLENERLPDSSGLVDLEDHGRGLPSKGNRCNLLYS